MNMPVQRAGQARPLLPSHFTPSRRERELGRVLCLYSKRGKVLGVWYTAYKLIDAFWLYDIRRVENSPIQPHALTVRISGNQYCIWMALAIHISYVTFRTYGLQSIALAFFVLQTEFHRVAQFDFELGIYSSLLSARIRGVNLYAWL